MTKYIVIIIVLLIIGFTLIETGPGSKGGKEYSDLQTVGWLIVGPIITLGLFRLIVWSLFEKD